MYKKLQIFLANFNFYKLVIYGVGQVFNLVSPLLIAPFIISLCGEENYGKTAIGMAIAFFLIVFVDFGSDIIGVRDVSVNRDNRANLSKIFVTTYSVKAIVLFLILCIASLTFITIDYFSEEKALFFLSLAVIIGQFINPGWFLQGLEEIKWLTVSNIISKIIFLAGVFYSLKKETDYIYVNLWLGIGMIISYSIFFVLIVRKYQINIKSVNRQETINFIMEHKSMVFSQIFVWVQLFAPVILVSLLGSKLTTGQYRIVDQIIAMFRTYIILTFSFIYPQICRQINSEFKIGFSNWIISNGLNFLLVFIGAVFIYFFSYDVVSFFNPTNRFLLSEVLKTAAVFPVLFVVSIAIKQLLLALNHNKSYIRTTIIMVFLNLFLIVIFYHKYQIYGVFYSLIITEMLTILGYLFIIRNDVFAKFIK